MTENAQHFQLQRTIAPTQITRFNNCDSDIGVGSRCPNCGLFHLRPGYCQALDPVSPGFRGSKEIQVAARAKLLAEFETVHGPIVTPRRTQPVTQLVTQLSLATQLPPVSVTQLAPPAQSVTQLGPSVTQLARRCEQCGNDFEASAFRPDARYCSAACRMKAHRAKS